MRVPRSQPPAYGSWKLSCSWSSGPRNMMTVRVRRAAATSMSLEVELGRRDDLEVVAVGQPAGAHADRGEHLEDPVDLLDAGEVAQRRAAAVEQGGAEQGDGGVLGRLDVDRAGAASGRRRCAGAAGRSGRARRTRSRGASPILASMSRLRFCLPCSMRVTAPWRGAEQLGSSDWVSPLWRRASRMRPPIRVR